MTDRFVGHYRVLESIGVGGMGEVFRAHDERLGRDVALKLIRQSSSENPDHLRRFEHEARAAAALNHPNIVAIHDVGFDNGAPFIVSELLEGQTLRQRLWQGPISVREAIDYTLQMTQGLIAAHERRIVHRDLKPENVFLTKEGRIKILDFGVAKQQPAEDPGRSVQELTTMTKSGSIIGTVAYMSPEQLRAKPVDHRSDIFSAGALFYEMLTGHRAFTGETEVDTMTAVLKEEPPAVNLEQANIPPECLDIVRHCLEKEPEKRFQSARDLAFALETLVGISPDARMRALRSRSNSSHRLPWAIAGVFLAAGLLLLGLVLRPAPSPPSYQRLTFEAGTVYSARFAPDGQSIVYGASWNNKPVQLYSTVGNSLLSQQLSLNDANLLAISRSNQLAVVLHGTHGGHLETEHGTLAEAPLAGGAPREILTDVPWADWDANGELAAVHSADGHSVLEYPIGHVLFQSGGWITHLRFSPNADQIAFIDHPSLWDDRGSLCVMDLSGHIRVISAVWKSAAGLAWRPDGKEVWFTASRDSSRNLMAITLSGSVRNLLDLPMGLTLQDVAPDGRALVSLDSQRLAMAATSLKDPAEVELSWHDWNVAKELSRDGQWVLFEDSSEVAGPSYAVAIRKLDGSLPIRLGEGSAGGLSPDGKWAISVLPRSVTLLPTGTGQPRHLEVAGLEKIQNGAARFLPDGKRIIVNANEAGHAVRGYVLDLNGGNPIAITPEGITAGMISPDGRFAVGIGTTGVVLYPLAGGSPRPVPSVGLGFQPVQWSEDGLAFYGYRPGELPSKIYRVEIATGKETLLKELRPGVPAGVVLVAPVVVSRDGSHFAYSYNQTLSVLYLISGLH